MEHPLQVLKGLRALLTVPEVSGDLLRATLQEYPSLLTEDCDVIGEGLASCQKSPEGRECVLRLVRLLRRCRQVGVEIAVSELVALGAAGRRQERLRATQHRLNEDRRRRTPRMPESPRTSWANGGAFASLAECRSWIESEYPQSTLTLLARSVDRPQADELFETSLPRYLYRGESGAFSSTTCSLDRLFASSAVNASGVEDIVRTAIRLRRDFEGEGWSALLSEGFLQHYGLPTRWLDVTASLDVAVSFACDLPVGAVGALFVAETSAVAAAMQVVDLRRFPNQAERPRRQAALAISDPQRCLRDFKDPRTVAACGGKWFSFAITESDAEQFQPDLLLLDAHSDHAAGLLQILLDSYAPMDDECARWMSQHIQPAPFVVVTERSADADGDVVARWVSAEAAGLAHDEGAASGRNYEHWSCKFPRVVPTPLPAELLSDAQELCRPGRVVRVCSRRGLEALGVLAGSTERVGDGDGDDG